MNLAICSSKFLNLYIKSYYKVDSLTYQYFTPKKVYITPEKVDTTPETALETAPETAPETVPETAIESAPAILQIDDTFEDWVLV